MILINYKKNSICIYTKESSLLYTSIPLLNVLVLAIVFSVHYTMMISVSCVSR